MIPAVNVALDTIVGNVTALRNAKGAGRAFELYIMTGIAVGLARQGCIVSVQRSDGSLVRATDADRRFIQRGGVPTGIAGASQGSGNASSFIFSLPSSTRQWEIWNGIQFIGRSGAAHEIDIAIIPHEVGVALRGLPVGGAPTGRPKVAIECKDVGSAGGPDEMRAFIARLYDLTILDGHWKVAHLAKPLQAIYPGAPAANDPYQTYWDGNRATFNSVARRTGFAAGSLGMSGYYGVQPRAPIFPGSSEDAALVQDLVNWILLELA